MSLVRGEAFHSCVVIPARNEGEALQENLKSLSRAAQSKRILVIIISNSSEATKNNPPNSEDFVRGDPLSILKIHRNFPPREGVGLARKMGADLAALLCENKLIESTYFFSTDADVRFPKDYFSVLEKTQGEAALLFPFIHIPESSNTLEQLSVSLYDLSLRYYVAGLEFAESPYAFQTIGSLLCLNTKAYVDVRGFPKRQAGEDFYLLNKLAKVGTVRTLEGPRLEVSGRLSDRVPFGTGIGVRRFLTTMKLHREPEFYNPKIFGVLKALLQSFRKLAEHKDLLKWQASLHPDLKTLGLHKELKNVITNFSKSERLLAEIHNHFDAFRTLKLVHYLRDRGYPNLPWAEAIHRSPFKVTAPAALPDSSKALKS